MDYAMVTGRMTLEKKEAGNAILERAGINPSQAVNLLYDMLIERQDASFLQPQAPTPSRDAWKKAAKAVDGLVLPWKVDPRFDNISNGQVAMERLTSKGLV